MDETSIKADEMISYVEENFFIVEKERGWKLCPKTSLLAKIMGNQTKDCKFSEKLRKKGTTKKPLVRMRQNRWICCG